MVGLFVGLLGIGLVIFFHELGHLAAAKSVGIRVEAFSVGWGRKIFGFTRGGTEYRFSWLPIGGYCKMQGEHALIRAWKTNANRMSPEPGDFYAARPWQRILVLAAGPLVNLLFAAVVLGTIALVGYTTKTFENRIVLVSDYGGPPSPADNAGLESGDYITSINQKPIENFSDLQAVVRVNPREPMPMSLIREGERLEVEITPALDTATGAGKIGVYPWVPPVVESVDPTSAAAVAGILPGDTIRSVNGTPTPHSIAVLSAIREGGPVSELQILRDSREQTVRIVPDSDENGTVSLGITYETIDVDSPAYSLPGAFVEGMSEAAQILVLTVRSLRLLFSGIDINQALMGPVRITVLAGEIATDGFTAGLGRGLMSFFNFLSLVSVALCFMNLLPIPALDGGQIVLCIVEGIGRRPLQPRFVYRYQVVGNVLIVLLMVFALFNDVLFFARG